MNRLHQTSRNRQKLQFEVSDLTGGFVSQAASYKINEKFVEDIQNMELIQGMWQTRKGFNQSGTYTTIDPRPGTIRGAHLYNDQGNVHLLVVSEEDLYTSKNLTGDNRGKVFSKRIPFS